MGDRANVIIKQDEKEAPVVIYSHWGGTSLENGALEGAISKAEGRVGDPHYFTAILVNDLMDAGLVSGIGTSLDDNEHPIMVVNSMTGEREEDMSEAGARAFLKEFQQL